MPVPKPNLSALRPDQEAELQALIERGLPWSTILEWCTGKGATTSESGLRRWASARSLRKPAATPELGPEGEDVVEKQLAQIEHLNAELSKADRTIKKLRAQTNQGVAVVDAVERAIQEHYDFESIELRPYPGPRLKEGTPQEFLAAISDAHYGEVVDPELAHGVAYNPEITRKRMAYLRDKIIRYADLRPYEISTLHACVIGDM